MRYMLMQFGDESALSTRSQEWVQQMIKFMIEFTAGLRESGELVAEEGLVLAPNAKVVSLEDGAVTTRDGTIAEPAQSLAGWWLVDVADEARALELARQIVAGAGEPVEVRRCHELPSPG
ncbi:YciI family protein [Nonomuraea sp. SYSU D8015]|uniref:YciI family protein n=1 Tax=Nonomuraea sp. SYSU D8015 TaxID=2593644 RepID=UPI0016616CBB|nr:YciI family protein [Nonomuraea sp. SYSU D8015]